MEFVIDLFKGNHGTYSMSIKHKKIREIGCGNIKGITSLKAVKRVVDRYIDETLSAAGVFLFWDKEDIKACFRKENELFDDVAAEMVDGYLEGHDYGLMEKDEELYLVDLNEEELKFQKTNYKEVMTKVALWNYELMGENSEQRRVVRENDGPREELLKLRIERAQLRYDSYILDQLGF